MNDERPDPDALLSALQKEEAAQRRGKLKVFLGMSAGVGKTYAMLEAAHRARREGREVVIGYVETHGRKETDALVAGLPLIPRRKVEYRGVTLEEMDIDAVLAQRPQLALVDELAHSNAPDSRHIKRYQVLAATLSALLWNFFFLPPRHTFLITNVQDALMFGMYFVVALVLGQLTARIRAQERAERRREKRSTALYLLTRDLADAASVDEMSQRLVAQVGRVFDCSVALLLREADGNLARRPHPASTFAVTEKEQSVAAWAFRFGKVAA